MIFCHKLGVVRVDVVLLHEVLVQDDLQEVQHNNTERKKDDRAQLCETEDQIQHCDYGNNSDRIRNLGSYMIDMVSTGEDGCHNGCIRYR